MPLAFLDRVRGVQCSPLNGRPMGVTTGHALVYHRAREKYDLRSVRKSNQYIAVFSTHWCKALRTWWRHPASRPRKYLRINHSQATKPKKGWIPCLRTGDVHAFTYSAKRLFVKYGEHLAHSKRTSAFHWTTACTPPSSYLGKPPTGSYIH